MSVLAFRHAILCFAVRSGILTERYVEADQMTTALISAEPIVTDADGG